MPRRRTPRLLFLQLDTATDRPATIVMAAAPPADFAQLSLDLQRANIRPADLWDVSRVYRTVSSPAPLINAKHGPTLTEVPGIPVTPEVLESFGMWFAVVTGALPLLDRTALRAAEPDYLWLTWPELVEELRWRVDNTPATGCCASPSPSWRATSGRRARTSSAS